MILRAVLRLRARLKNRELCRGRRKEADLFGNTRLIIRLLTSAPAILRQALSVLVGMAGGVVITVRSAEPALPGVRVVPLNVPAAGKAGFTLLRPEQTRVDFT